MTLRKKAFLLGIALLTCAFCGCGTTEDPGSGSGQPSEDATLTGIWIGGHFQKRYLIGEKFDPTGMTVTATYSDGTTAEIEDYAILPDTELTANTTRITVEYNGLMTSWPITVGRDRATNTVREEFTRETFRYEPFGDLLYRMRMPDNKMGKVPLVLWLHGAGEKGDDNDKQLNLGILKMFASFKCEIYDSLVIAPQCPDTTRWAMPAGGIYHLEDYPETLAMQAVVALLKQCMQLDFVDTNRVYVAGLSMGGTGTWDILMRHGDLFAAGMPMCGGGDPNQAPALSEIPIYTIHSDGDTISSVDVTRQLVAAIQAMGKGKIYYHELHNINHYTDEFLTFEGDDTLPSPIPWLFEQTKLDRE